MFPFVGIIFDFEDLLEYLLPDDAKDLFFLIFCGLLFSPLWVPLVLIMIGFFAVMAIAGLFVRITKGLESVLLRGLSEKAKSVISLTFLGAIGTYFEPRLPFIIITLLSVLGFFSYFKLLVVLCEPQVDRWREASWSQHLVSIGFSLASLGWLVFVAGHPWILE